jgi:hypothetical protein
MNTEGAKMNSLCHSRACPRASCSQRDDKQPSIRQQLEQDAWVNHYRFACRLALRPRRTRSGWQVTNRSRLTRSLLLLLCLLACSSSARARDAVVFGEATADRWGIEFRGDDLPPHSVALDTEIKADSCLVFGRTGEKLEGSASLLPVGSSVNLASFSSTASGWKAQLAYSLATLLSATSLLWFCTPSRRIQAGGLPPPPVHSIELRAMEQRAR